MAKLRLQLSPSQKLDLQKILSADPTALSQAASDVDASAHLLRPAELRSELSSRLEGDLAAALTRLGIALIAAKRRYRSSINDVFVAIDGVVRNEPELAKQQAVWQRVRGTLERLFVSAPFNSVTKAVHLGLDHAALLDDARIICDVRPVFDDHQSSVVGAIVTHVLRLDYYTDDGLRTLSVAMSEDDLKRMTEACKLAKQKAEKLKDSLKAGIKVDAFIAGEENYDL